MLRSRAKTFVFAAWVLLMVAIPVCLVLGAAAGFDKFYFPTHPHATLDAYDLGASKLIMTSAAFAAVLSSIALALGFRATASILVVLIWTPTIAGTQIGRSLVEPGPDYYERHIGPEAFLVPWKYADAGPGRPPARSPMRSVSPSISAYPISGGAPTSIVAGFNPSKFFQPIKVLPIRPWKHGANTGPG